MSAAREAPAAPPAPPTAAEASAITNDPIVKRAVELLGGRVLNVDPRRSTP